MLVIPYFFVIAIKNIVGANCSVVIEVDGGATSDKNLTNIDFFQEIGMVSCINVKILEQTDSVLITAKNDF